MAPIKDAVGPSQEALLNLEKSTASPDAQLDQAAHILRLDWSLDATDAAVYLKKSPEATRPAPKEQWVLRWLLKRLKTKPYRIHPRSFLLLQKLVQRLPRKAVAVTLADNKFPQLLKDIVEDLDSAVVQSLQQDSAPSGSETSATLDRSPVRPKKRKRDSEIENQAGQNAPQPAVVVSAYVSFLGSLYTLTALAKGRENNADISQIHLKQSLRAEPVFIAPILGKLLRLSARLVAKFAKEKNGSQLQHLLKVTTAAFTLWDFKKHNVSGNEKNDFNVSFSDHCFLEALRLYRLVLCVGGMSESADFIVHSVEKLIALHVVIPARAAFISRGGSGIDYSKDNDPDWSAVQPVTATFKPLLEDRLSENVDCSGIEASPQAEKNVCIFAPTWRPAELVPTFYNIIARSVPRNSFRRQAGEASWLETAFVALAELAYSMTKPITRNTSDFIPLLEQLFIVVRTLNIKLSLHTFLTHAAYTGLLKGKDNPQDVHWNLTALLVELGVDIFLPNSGLKDSQRLLDAVLLTLSQIRSRQTGQETYQVIKNGVVIPLLRAFSAARDLPSLIQQWLGQLREVEVSRGPSLPFEDAYSVWEDEDVAAAFREVMKTSLSESQLRSIIQGAINDVASTTETLAISPESYASVVLLEISSDVWGQHGIPGLQIELVTALAKANSKTVLLQSNIHWKWRLWRLARKLLPITLKDSQNGPNDLAETLERAALKVTTQSAQQPLADAVSNNLREALEACRFLLQATKDLQHSSSVGEVIVQPLLGNVTKLFQTLLSSKEKHMPRWNGRIEGLDTSAQLGAAYIVCMMEFPHVWRRLPAKYLEEFLNCFLRLASRTKESQATENSSRGASFYQLWEVVVSYDYLLDIAPLCSGLAQVLFRHLKDDSGQRLFVLGFLPRIPVRLHGVDGANDAMASLMKGNFCTPESIPDAISLVSKWCRESTTIDTAVKDWITSSLPLQGTSDDIYTMQSFRTLAENIFEHELQECNPAEIPKLLKRYFKIASRVSAVESENMEFSLNPVLVTVLFRKVWEHRVEAQDAKLAKEIPRQRQKLLEFVLGGIDTGKQLLQEEKELDTRAAVELVIIFYMLKDLQDLVQENRTAGKRVAEIYKVVQGTSLSSGHFLHRAVRQQQLVEFSHEDSFVLDDARLVQAVDLQQLYADEQEQFVRDTTAKLEAMSNAERLQTIRELQDHGFDGPAGSCRLLMAGLAVSTLEEIPERGSEEAQVLSSLCTAVTNVIQDSETVEQFSFAAECLDIILRLHPRGVSQYNIDKCLSAVSTTISNVSSTENSRQVSASFASTIYTRLCRVLGTLFGLYRQQLGGRFHVLVPALQSLLKALFAPSRKRKRSATSTLASALGVPHAVMFSRLLSSLCDPTVSAVSRAGAGHDGLVDQTKKAKLIAGQHLRIVIESYTANMLDGPISAEIKAALAPGLYAVLDAMSTETKRALNASLDVSSRAIFKTLHDDYVRFGKWNNKG
ncbi:DNA repair protein RAD50 [Talaromyces islandicus]|uniref:DNA repair protein RAD50 n=1 Tax=Talaromyces islandicus TaxID=28573 RepID=A0A0U1M299_TALIS|nr:DNA repair protein RAD50 [Talaromyces islandicus]